MSRKDQGPSLFKIIAAIVVFGGVAFGIMQVSLFFQDYLNRGVEAAAVKNLDKARELFEQGDMLEAAKLLRPILARVDDPAISPRALMLQAELDRKAGDLDAALEHLQAASEDFEDSAEQPAASLAYAALLEERGRTDEALAVYARVRKTAPPALRAPALIALGRHKESLKDREAARQLFTQAMEDAEWGSDAWLDAAQRVGGMNVAAIFSPAPTPESEVYRVVSGDTLTTIGIRFNTTQGLLLRANNLENANRLRLNQTLKYTPKDFEIVIELSTKRLYLLDSQGVFNVYSVGLGKPGNDTTPGKYKIGNKEKNPTWYKPGFGPIPPGDPRNELGTRWMPLVPEEERLPTDLGVHGTIDPETVGVYSSMGCPRLYNDEAEELYDLVVRSTPVTIVEVYNPRQMG
ncbi:MAG: L,D-transpeptidase family protein [Candidatus Hydrogenedentes bacterium]|nr:L,D-transpeptidase family protein [Candidatus Hydrogenedentota bacterium]